MITADFLRFLYDLSQNNNRDWFEQNKKRYELSVKKPFEKTVGEIIDRLKSFEPDFQITPKDCVFRLHRDTRFSKDKSPYKTHVAAVFTARGRKTMHHPGYYLHIEYGALEIGGGAYFMEKEGLQKVRTAIAQDIQGFQSILKAEPFHSRFPEIHGEKNKILPAEFREAARSEPLLFHKNFYFMTSLDPENALRPDFPGFVAEYFQAAKEFNDFMKKALGL